MTGQPASQTELSEEGRGGLGAGWPWGPPNEEEEQVCPLPPKEHDEQVCPPAPKEEEEQGCPPLLMLEDRQKKKGKNKMSSS